MGGTSRLPEPERLALYSLQPGEVGSGHIFYFQVYFRSEERTA